MGFKDSYGGSGLTGLTVSQSLSLFFLHITNWNNDDVDALLGLSHRSFPRHKPADDASLTPEHVCQRPTEWQSSLLFPDDRQVSSQFGSNWLTAS
jgi:hypothetical protein